MFSISSSSCCCVRFAVPFGHVSISKLFHNTPTVPSRLGCTYLEGKVLKKVGGAICLCGLGSRTGIDPHANGRGLGVG